MPAQPSFPQAAAAADHGLASHAGLEVLRAGGNAVDAAVAASFALSVVRPYSCGVGGGGFMVVHLRDHKALGATPDHPVTTAINYRETCPAAVGPDYFEAITDPDAATRGGRAVAIPGHVAGMLHALEKFGTMPRADVLAPATRLARDGFKVDAHYIESVQDVLEWARDGAKDAEAPLNTAKLKRTPFLWTRFLRQGAVKVGDHIALPEQAALLTAIARDGAPAFYTGDTARRIVDAVHHDGGELSLEDLAGFKVQELRPFTTHFAGRTFLGMPPPSSGGIVVAQVLAMLEHRRDDVHRIVQRHGHNSAEFIHFVAEACKHAFADRARWLGDTDFVNVPLERLLDPVYLRTRADAIREDRTFPQDVYGMAAPPRDSHGTSHLCVVDAAGNAVACTETINLVFGSLIAVPECGFILNDTMDDFVTRAGHANAFGLEHGARNRPQPGKRPLSCMTPTIVLEDQNPASPVFMLAGASGGPRIITGTLQALLNVLLFDCDALDAVSRPRFHHQWSPHTLQLEDALLQSPVKTALENLGHAVSRRQPVGAVQVIRRKHNAWQPASDPRKGGAPAGM
ncbi:MAG: gamma-glutamyltransferase [Phycisphaerales bacterium]